MKRHFDFRSYLIMRKKKRSIYQLLSVAKNGCPFRRIYEIISRIGRSIIENKWKKAINIKHPFALAVWHRLFMVINQDRISRSIMFQPICEKKRSAKNQLSVTPATSQETPTASDVPEHVDKRTTQATTHLSVEQRTPKLKPDRHRKQRKRSRKTEQKPIPFNVMMTENDKRNYAKTTRSKTK